MNSLILGTLGALSFLSGPEITISSIPATVGQTGGFHLHMESLNEIDQIVMIHASEEIHPPAPGGTLFMDDPKETCLSIKKFERHKKFSRTRQIFEIDRFQPCSSKGFVYKSPFPAKAMDYPFELRFYKKNVLIAARRFVVPVSPGDAIFVSCHLLIKNETPVLRCVPLDSYGNLSPDEITITGSFQENDTKNYTFQGILEVTAEKLPPFARFYYRYKDQDFISNPLMDSKRPVWFGDLHSHSVFSDARVPVLPQELYLYMKEVSSLDFGAITDHTEGVFGEPLSKAEKRILETATNSFNTNDQFTAFNGMEWTSTFENPNSLWGHRSVIFPSNSITLCRSDLEECNTTEKLYKITGPVFSFPHHTMISWGGFGFETPMNLEFEKAFEILSCHGGNESPELYTGPEKPVAEGAISNLLKKRIPLRILANSDTHNGHPGLNNWPGIQVYLNNEIGGLTAVYAQKNTRTELYEALQNQFFYATSGTRILLYPHTMQSPFPLEIHATAPLKSLEIVGIDKLDHFFTKIIHLEGLDTTVHEPDLKEVQAFYLKVSQTDGEMAWIGPWYY